MVRLPSSVGICPMNLEPLKMRRVKEVSCPSSAGIVPVSSVEEMVKNRRFVSVPSSVGSVPESWFWCRSSSTRLFSFEKIALSSGPASWVSVMSNPCRFTKFAIDVWRVPVRPFSDSVMFVSPSSSAISGGMCPDKPLSSKMMADTRSWPWRRRTLDDGSVFGTAAVRCRVAVCVLFVGDDRRARLW